MKLNLILKILTQEVLVSQECNKVTLQMNYSLSWNIKMWLSKSDMKDERKILIL